MNFRGRSGPLLTAIVAGCVGNPAPEPVPVLPPPPPPPVQRPVEPAREVTLAPVVPLGRGPAAAAAWQAGLMPLHSTGVTQFAELSPGKDGRGVLIAILDSGIDPAVEGLSTTSDGKPKLLDLRDFSGEGRIELAPVAIMGDTMVVKGRPIAGANRLAARTDAVIWGGVVPEARFGVPPAADLNGDGDIADSLVLVVARTTRGWELWPDRDGDGSIASERPVRDYLVAREYFGWSAGGMAPLGVAVNLSDSAGVPLLDLVFDQSGHGTHVAGIAAGHRHYGVDGFDGVAPGAQLLGLKIANNAEGGITTTGSMIGALEHAVATARSLGMPLVVNLSFGVGNQQEGTAEIDRMVDSVLAANPDVVMTVAASNDGPGLSTLGFPASASRVLSVGATHPLVFENVPRDTLRLDPVAIFSSRGGERAGPDLVTPGFAWSSVPQFDVGNEEKSGTSMAAPHAAGLVARLINVLQSENRAPDRSLLHQALLATARPLPDASILDQGAGVPDLWAASRWLRSHHDVPALLAVDEADSRRDAVWVDGAAIPPTVKFRVSRRDSRAALRINVRSEVPWLEVEGPSMRRLGPSGVAVYLKVIESALPRSSAMVGVVRVESADHPELGALLRVPVTLRRSLAIGDTSTTTLTVRAGSVARVFFAADTGRAVRIDAATTVSGAMALLALHEPGGQPFRDVPMVPVGHADGIVPVIGVDARDVRAGLHEMVLAAPPASGVAVRARVHHSPLRLGATLQRDSLTVTASGLAPEVVRAALRVAFTGSEWRGRLGGPGSIRSDTMLAVPEWASAMVLDVSMPEADWSRFSDFGVTVWRRDGVLVETTPLNYATGRMRLEVPAAARGDSLRLSLRPAASNPDRPVPWQVMVHAKFELPNPVPVDRGGSGVLEIPPGVTVQRTFAVPRWPVPIPECHSPLVTVVALEGETGFWTREVPLLRGTEMAP